jgi:23S rRNA pseudouridine2605 synthase
VTNIPDNSEKIQKVLARAGFGSRRKLEELIEAGRVTVDGRLANIGLRVKAAAKIAIDGKAVTITPADELACRVLLYHKPEGEICTRQDPEKRPTVFDNLPKLQKGRWIAVGRLDFNTAGLLIFTTHGDLANALMHPKSNIEREYAVRVSGKIDPKILQRLCQGVKLEDGLAKFNTVTDAGGQGHNHWYHVTLNEGRNREVRRLWESQGIQVNRLIRIRYGELLLPRDLRKGQTLELSSSKIKQLAAQVNLTVKPYSPQPRKYKPI